MGAEARRGAGVSRRRTRLLEAETRHHGEVVGGGSSRRRWILGDRRRLLRVGVDALDGLDEGVACEDVVDELSAPAKAAAEAPLLGG